MVLLGWCIHDLARLFFFVFVCSFPSLPSCRIRHRPSHCIIARAHLPAFLDREKKAHIHEIDDEHRTRTWDSFFSFFAYHFLETLPIEDDRLLVESTRFLYIYRNSQTQHNAKVKAKAKGTLTHLPIRPAWFYLYRNKRKKDRNTSHTIPHLLVIFFTFFFHYFLLGTPMCVHHHQPSSIPLPSAIIPIYPPPRNRNASAGYLASSSVFNFWFLFFILLSRNYIHTTSTARRICLFFIFAYRRTINVFFSQFTTPFSFLHSPPFPYIIRARQDLFVSVFFYLSLGSVSAIVVYIHTFFFLLCRDFICKNG